MKKIISFFIRLLNLILLAILILLPSLQPLNQSYTEPSSRRVTKEKVENRVEGGNQKQAASQFISHDLSQAIANASRLILRGEIISR